MPRELAFAGAASLALFVVLGIVAIAALARKRDDAPRPPDFAPMPVVATASPIRTDFEGEITDVGWRRTITIETYQLVSHEGFADSVPKDAVEVRAAGQREHHREDVFDHDETVYDEVEVPDGTRTETYTERVSCGQDCTTSPRVCRPNCTTTPRVCRQNCTNKKNGFASCTESCSGGTRSCSDECSGGTTTCTTKYCNEQRTRQIPKTRKERRPRVVKKYRSEPRFAPWSTYKNWEWAAPQTFEARGDGTTPAWPELVADGGVAIKHPPDAGGAPKPGDRREIRAEAFHATIRTDDGVARTFVPASAEELARLGLGTSHKVKVEGAAVRLVE